MPLLISPIFVGDTRPCRLNTNGSAGSAFDGRFGCSCMKGSVRLPCGKTFQRDFAKRSIAGAWCTPDQVMANRVQGPQMTTGESTLCIGKRTKFCQRF